MPSTLRFDVMARYNENELDETEAQDALATTLAAAKDAHNEAARKKVTAGAALTAAQAAFSPAEDYCRPLQDVYEAAKRDRKPQNVIDTAGRNYARALKRHNAEKLSQAVSDAETVYATACDDERATHAALVQATLAHNARAQQPRIVVPPPPKVDPSLASMLPSPIRDSPGIESDDSVEVTRPSASRSLSTSSGTRRSKRVSAAADVDPARLWRCRLCRRTEDESEQGKIVCNVKGCKASYCFSCARCRRKPQIFVCPNCMESSLVGRTEMPYYDKGRNESFWLVRKVLREEPAGWEPAGLRGRTKYSESMRMLGEPAAIPIYYEVQKFGHVQQGFVGLQIAQTHLTADELRQRGIDGPAALKGIFDKPHSGCDKCGQAQAFLNAQHLLRCHYKCCKIRRCWSCAQVKTHPGHWLCDKHIDPAVQASIAKVFKKPHNLPFVDLPVARILSCMGGAQFSVAYHGYGRRTTTIEEMDSDDVPEEAQKYNGGALFDEDLLKICPRRFRRFLEQERASPYASHPFCAYINRNAERFQLAIDLDHRPSSEADIPRAIDLDGRPAKRGRSSY